MALLAHFFTAATTRGALVCGGVVEAKCVRRLKRGRVADSGRLRDPSAFAWIVALCMMNVKFLSITLSRFKITCAISSDRMCITRFDIREACECSNSGHATIRDRRCSAREGCVTKTSAGGKVDTVLSLEPGAPVVKQR